jgi:hypothetical protein
MPSEHLRATKRIAYISWRATTRSERFSVKFKE